MNAAKERVMRAEVGWANCVKELEKAEERERNTHDALMHEHDLAVEAEAELDSLRAVADFDGALADTADNLRIERDILREKISKWFPNYKGMCEELYGVKEGKVNWPAYRCQAQEVYEEMYAAARVPKEAADGKAK